jgi:hypothetical protein
MTNAAFSGHGRAVGCLTSVSRRLKGWLREFKGGRRPAGHGLEALEGRQLLSVPTLVPVGPELSVTTGATPPPGIAVSGDGSFVLAWTANSDSGQSVAGMQFSKELPPGDVIDVSGQSTTSANFLPNVASGKDGGFLVVWNGVDTTQEGSPTEIFGRAYGADGKALGAGFEIGSTTTGSAFLPSVGTLSDGGYVVTWYAYNGTQGDQTPVGVFAQMFESDGSAKGDVFQANTSVDSRGMTLPQVEVSANGDFAIAWMREDKDTKQTAIIAQAFNESGKKLGQETVVEQAPAIFEELGGHMPTYSFGVDAEGNYLFAWDQTQDGGPWSVYGQYFDPYFHAQGDAFEISGASESSQYYSSVGFAPNGSAVVVWQGSRIEGEESGRVVLGVQLDGLNVVNRFDVSTVLDGSHVDLKPRMEVDSFGGFTAAWTGYGAPTGTVSSLIIRTFMAVEAAEITVTGDGSAIDNGSTQTSIDNNTDFGFVDSEGGTHTGVFAIQNMGNIALDLGSITLPEGFTLATPPTTVAPGQTGNIEIMLAGTAGIGVHSGVVSIPNNVEGMNPFTFTITGEVLERKKAVFTKNTPAAQRTFIDEEGNTVVFSLTGPGVGSISFNPRTHELVDLELENTTRSSNLTINVSQTKGEGSGFTTIDNVHIHGSLNAFRASKVDLFGDFIAHGSLATLVMADLFGLDEHHINIGGSANSRTDFTFGEINDLHLETNGYIGQFTAIEWLDLNDEKDEMFAGSIVAINITGQTKTSSRPFVAGDMSVDISTFNTGRPLGQPSVGSITVAGQAYDSLWDLHGYTGAIKLGSAQDIDVRCEDGFGSFIVAGAVDESYLLAGYVQDDVPDGFVGAVGGKVTVGAWTGGEIGANTLQSFTATGRAKTATQEALSGDVFDVGLTVQGFDLADNALAITSFKAMGLTGQVELESGGNVGSVWLGQGSEDFHVHGDGDLRSFTAMGLVQEGQLDLLGTIGTVQAAHWTGGSIEAVSLNLLNITGRAKSATLPALHGDIDAQVTLHGNLDKTSANTLGTVRVAGKLHGVDGRTIDIDVTGSVGTVTSGSLERLAFTVRPYFGSAQTKIGSVTTGYTDYWDITAPGVALGSITVAQWHDGELYVDKVGTLRVTGQAAKAGQPAIPADFQGIVVLDGTRTKTGNLLGSATIGGQVSDSKWEIKGSAGSLTVGSADKFEVKVEGNLASFVSNGRVTNQSNVAVNGVLQSLRAVAWSVGGIHAWKIGSVTTTGQAKSAGKDAIAGDFAGVIEVTGENQVSGALLLGNVTVAGVLSASVIASPGNVGTIRSSAFIDSSVFVGIGAGFPVGAIARHKADFANPTAKLQSCVVTGNGWAANTASFINGHVSAGELTSVSIKLVGSVSGELPTFGFSAATKIGNYRRLKLVDGVEQAVVVTNKTLPGIYDQDGLYMLTLADEGMQPPE